MKIEIYPLSDDEVACSISCRDTWDGYVLHDPECTRFDQERWKDYIANTVEV